MIAIVDYGMGNLRSVERGFAKMGVEAEITRDASVVTRASGVVLPGQGHFGSCMENLARYGLVTPIRDFIESGRPFLGICIGLQLLFDGSEESPEVGGLGVLGGRVVRFSDTDSGLKIPHMGWNTVSIRQQTPLTEGIPDGSRVYFVHSYYPVPDDASVVLTTTEYGVEFASSVARGNLYAMQFHPEKSSGLGLRILENFGRIVSAG